MTTIDELHVRLLRRGLNAIRDASYKGDLEYCKAESEHLHVLPALIGEVNQGPHRYYATKHRAAYLEWVATHHRQDVKEFIDRWYAGVWKELDSILNLEAERQV